MRRAAILTVALVTVIGLAPTTVGRDRARAAEEPAPAAVPLPEPLRDLIAVLGPLASPACGAAGLAGTLIGTGGTTNPAAGEIYRALSPVFLVCGLLPAPEVPTRCSVDAPIDSLVSSLAPALGGLLPLPRPGGQLIDTLTALEVLIVAQTGKPLDPTVETLLRALLDCHTPEPAPPAEDGSAIELDLPSSPASPVTPPAFDLPEPTTPAPVVAEPARPAGPRAPVAVGVTTSPPSSNAVRLIAAAGLFVALGPLAVGRRGRRAGHA